MIGSLGIFVGCLAFTWGLFNISAINIAGQVILCFGAALCVGEHSEAALACSHCVPASLYALGAVTKNVCGQCQVSPVERRDSRIAPRLMVTAPASSSAFQMWNFWWQQATHLSPMALIHKWAKPQDIQHMLLPETFCCSITRQKKKKILASRLDGIISGVYQEIRQDLFLDEAWLITQGKLLICLA